MLCKTYVCNCGKTEYDWIEKLLDLDFEYGSYI
jgi:hypothetical protein